MAKDPKPLPIFDRRTGKLVEEWMDDYQATYDAKPHKSLTGWIQSQSLYDWAYAAMQETRRSARKIKPFVEKYRIDMSEFEAVEYRSYAEFFDRYFKPGCRRGSCWNSAAWPPVG